MNIDVCFDTETTPTDPITCYNQEPPLPSVLALLLHLLSEFFSLYCILKSIESYVAFKDLAWMMQADPAQNIYLLITHELPHYIWVCSDLLKVIWQFIRVYPSSLLPRNWKEELKFGMSAVSSTWPTCICLPDCTHLPLCGVVTPSRTWLPSKKSGKLWPLFLPIVDLC